MQNLRRQFLIEFLWLLVSLLLTVILSLLVVGKNFLTHSLDIHLHDTYFVIAPLHVLLPIFFTFTFLIYFIKEFRNSFSRTIPNWIFLFAGLVLVILLTLSIKIFSQFFTGGWTLYPPLSALTPGTEPQFTQDPTARFIVNFFTAVQIIILTMLLSGVYRWGKSKSRITV